MANKNLKSIKFPGLSDTYVIAVQPEDLKTKADLNAYMTEIATGAIASFDDGADNIPMKSLLVNIDPVQSGSGDPSPSNVRAINGHSAVNVYKGGRNLYNASVQRINSDFTSRSGDVFTVAWTNGAIQISGKTLDGTFLQTFPAGTYTVKLAGSGSISNIIVQIASKSTNNALKTIYGPQNAYTFTATEEFYVVIYGNYNNPGTATFTVQLEAGETAHDYEAYKSFTDLTISLGQTVYGGTLDVVSGEGTDDMKLVDLGNYTWLGSNGVFYIRLDDAYAPYNDYDFIAKAVCSNYKVMSRNALYTNTNNNAFSIHKTDHVYFTIRDNSYTAASAFQSAMNGVNLCYQVATGTALTLSATEVDTLLGANNIWADTGDTTAEYRADATLAYNKIISRLEALEG